MSKTEMPREWARGPQWNPESRKEWEPILRSARHAWNELETLSVSEGLRSSALLHISPDELILATREAVEHGFAIVPLEYGRQYRVAFTLPDLVSKWIEAWSGNDDDAIGKLLGFPDCCREHFTKTWAQGISDTARTIAKCDDPRGLLNVDGPAEANILLRHLGVRLVPHLPCSPTCEVTVETGKDMIDLGMRNGIDIGSILKLLNLPATYHALHGVAIIETPHFKLWAGTDYTPEDVVIKRSETQTSISVNLTGPMGPVPPEPTSYQDNGFSTEKGMEWSHHPILKTIEGLRSHDYGVNSILDLGAGDGTLLSKIDAERRIGVEREVARADRGRARHPEVKLAVGLIENLPNYIDPAGFDVVLLMPGRLLEMDTVARSMLLAQLKDAGNIVAYAYGDWLTKYTFEGLCEATGLKIESHLHGSSAPAAAAVVSIV